MIYFIAMAEKVESANAQRSRGSWSSAIVCFWEDLGAVLCGSGGGLAVRGRGDSNENRIAGGLGCAD